MVDDARSHISLLRMLRQFHYIDNNGKDQGINIRNRSQELAKLLGDVDAIRAERKKAKANRNKFGGFEGGIGAGGFSGGFSGGSGGFGSGGFGSDNAGFGGFSGGVYGDGGGFGGDTSGFRDTGRRTNRFEEYDENEDDGYRAPRRTERTPPVTRQAPPKKPEPKEPEQDLVSFDDDDFLAPAPTTTAPSQPVSAGKQPAGNGLANLTGNDDDDFDDFQSASPTTPATAQQSQFSSIPPPMGSTSSAQQFAAPKPVSGTQGANLNGLVGLTSVPPTPSTASNMSPLSSKPPSLSVQSPAMSSQPMKPSGYQAMQPNYFTSVSVGQTQQTASKPSSASGTSASKPAGSKSAGDAFGSIWSSASASAGIKQSAPQPKGPNLASMVKEKASAGIWGTAAQPTSTGTGPTQSQHKSTGSAVDDLLG